MVEKYTTNGGCHCGNIRYKLITSMPPKELPLRACECSFCSKQGANYTSDPEGELVINIEEDDMVQRYRFGTKTADFVFCRKCGVMPFVLSKIEGKTFAGVNINTSDKEYNTNHIKRVSFSGESIEERMERRKRSWIGRVTGNMDGLL